jgi:hypothetical protein
MLAALGQVMHSHGLYQIWPDVPNICNSLVMFTFMAVIGVRFINKVVRHSNDCIQELFKTTITFYEQEEQTPKHRAVLHANLKLLMSVLNFFFWFTLIGIYIPAPVAWILSWYTGELILLAPVYLPYTDPKIPFWYIVNSAFVVFFELFLFVAYMASDLLYIFFIFQTFPMVEIYCMKMSKFGVKLIQIKTEKVAEQPGPSTSKMHAKDLRVFKDQMAFEKAKEIETIERQLVTLIKEFNTYNEYVAVVLYYMEFSLFASTSLDSMAIGMAIVVTLYYSKAIGGIMILYLFSLVLVPCIQGTVILHQKEKLLNAICAFPWYELSKSKQKMFLQLIHLAQNANEFVVPIIGSIDMELFADVVNGGYSYFNFLYNFVDDL